MVGSSMVGGPCGEGIGVGIRQEDDDLVTRFYEAIAVAKEAARSASCRRSGFGFDASA